MLFSFASNRLPNMVRPTACLVLSEAQLLPSHPQQDLRHPHPPPHQQSLPRTPSPLLCPCRLWASLLTTSSRQNLLLLHIISFTSFRASKKWEYLSVPWLFDLRTYTASQRTMYHFSISRASQEVTADPTMARFILWAAWEVSCQACPHCGRPLDLDLPVLQPESKSNNYRSKRTWNISTPLSPRFLASG